MSDSKALEMKCVKDLVADSEVASPVVSKRSFEYNLNDKSAKTKLLKSAKRKPFEIVEHSTSSTLVFSPGAWNQVVQPSAKYWKSIQGDKTCIAGPIIVKVASVNAGEDAGKNHIDTLIVFYSNRDKVVFTMYNTTQRILVKIRC